MDKVDTSVSPLLKSALMTITHSDHSARVCQLLGATPGITTLAALVDIDPARLAPTACIDYLSALERQTSWLQALMHNAIVAVAGVQASRAQGIFEGIDDAEREDVASALRLSTGTAQIRIDVARTLVNHLPNTCSALAAGEISPAHATVIARETASAIRDGLGAAHIFQIEQSALAHAEFHTPAQVANKVRTTLAHLAPVEFEEACERASDSRRVSMYKESDGLATVIAILPAADAQIVMKAIENFIDVQSANEMTDTRNIDMKRADALTSMATWALSSAPSGIEHHRRPVSVNVTIDVQTLLGLAQNPAQLAGYGAIAPSVARALASDGKWRRFITDPQTGALLDYGRNSYEPPQALVDFLIARDRTCRFPGCHMAATKSDLDHAKSWDSGGETSPANLGALCRRHHRLKTHGGWMLESSADGACTWTSPLGKKYVVPARPMFEAV